MDDMDKLRDRLGVVLRGSPKAISEIARCMDVSNDLVRNFISGKRRTHFKSLSKIEAWIESEEKRLDII